MLGYEKGPDGAPVVIPEEAEIICRIFEWYLAGRSVQNIRQALEASGVRNAAGTTEWTTSNLRSILTNEKYCGDALLQKTFIKDCISKKAILNTGSFPKSSSRTTMKLSSAARCSMLCSLKLRGAVHRMDAQGKVLPPDAANSAASTRSADCYSARNAAQPTDASYGHSTAKSARYGAARAAWTMERDTAAFSDARRGASPTGHTERRQFCHVRSRHSDRAAY